MCKVRANVEGRLYTQLYGRVVAACPDPIERLPMFHVCPGSRSFSVAALGLNFRSAAVHKYSKWGLSRADFPVTELTYTPADIAALAVRSKCRSIAYTCTEPTIYYEFARDTMEEAKAAGLLNIIVTNGYMTQETIDDSEELIDAANVDLWTVSNGRYESCFDARLDGVEDTLRMFKDKGIWLEITTVLVPGLNAGPEDIRNTARYIRSELGRETPWHIGRHHPHYSETDAEALNPEVLMEAKQVGLDEGLLYVYVMDGTGSAQRGTYCPQCTSELIRRESGQSVTSGLKDGACPDCGHVPEGITMSGDNRES